MLSTLLISLNYPVILSHRRSTNLFRNLPSTQTLFRPLNKRHRSLYVIALRKCFLASSIRNKTSSCISSKHSSIIAINCQSNSHCFNRRHSPTNCSGYNYKCYSNFRIHSSHTSLRYDYLLGQAVATTDASFIASLHCELSEGGLRDLKYSHDMKIAILISALYKYNYNN